MGLTDASMVYEEVTGDVLLARLPPPIGHGLCPDAMEFGFRKTQRSVRKDANSID